jgi:polyphosphate kinase
MPSIYAFTSINAKKTSLREEYPENLSQTVIDYIQGHLEDFGRIFTRQFYPLEENNIHLYYGIKKQKKETQSTFCKVLSFLQPVILKKRKPIIFLENNYLYFIVDIEDTPGVHEYAC